MKYFKRSKIYKASNVTFDPLSCEAFSYGHWQFVKRLENGKVIFNNYSYSPTTQRHQRKVWNLMEKLNIKIDLELRFSKYSLNDTLFFILKDEIKRTGRAIGEIQSLIAKKGTRKTTNKRRKEEIKELQAHKAKVNKYLTPS